MKRCTYCGQKQPDEAEVCPLDQQPLELIGSTPHTPSASPDEQSRKNWAMQVLLPAAGWLFLNLLLMGIFSLAASFVLGLLAAVWATIDCSKLRSKGSDQSDTVFRPIVVFAVVAFLFLGFGFIWYLVMRHNFMSVPVASKSESASEEPAETWKCQTCGEENPMSFDSCWKCRTKGRSDVIIPENTPFTSFPRGGNPWE